MKDYENPEIKIILLGEDDIRTDNGGTSGITDGGQLSSLDPSLGVK